MKENIWKYFKVGDIVKNPDVWGDKLFVIYKKAGNAYCPEFYVYPYGKDKSPGRMCIFAVSMTKLYNTNKRPFRKLSKPMLIKVMNKGNIEARREFFIRLNQKLLK